MGVKFANNAYGTLNAGITSSDTSLTLSSGQGARFPTLASGDYFYATLIDTSNNLEIIKVTARSTDVLTIVRGQENTTARSYSIGDRIELRITGGSLEDAANPYDKDSSSTGSFSLPVGTTAQEPAAASSTGHIRFDTDLGTVTFSDGTDWYKIAAAIAQLSSVSGTILAGAASTLTLTGSGFLASNLVVNFKQTSDSIDVDVTVTPTSDTTATVTVPSTVYSNVTAGNVVNVQVTNSDGMSSAAINKTAVALPSGGTVTTSGSNRIHTFTTSGTFVVPTGLTLSDVEYLVIAGGGGGGGANGSNSVGGGGGGAGGYRCSVTGESSGGGASAESKLSLSAGSYTVTVGAGGAAGSAGGDNGDNGSNSVFASITSLGGGGGATGSSLGVGSSGGSGGGGGYQGTGGSGTSGQGYAGGGVGTSDTAASGGGGAGQVGGTGAVRSGTGRPGNGGNGLSSSITGTAVTRAGGGGGAIYNSDTSIQGTGGAGGGGEGGWASDVQGDAGAANTGSGGGGGARISSTGYQGSSGGSGIVIVRYQL